MISRSPLILVAAAIAFGGGPASASHPPGESDCTATVGKDRALAHPIVTGAVGPFARTTLVLERTEASPQAPFTGRLITPSGCIAVPGPDEPADFFLFDVRAVIFTPLDRTATRGLVILVDRSQIGPGRGTEHVALAYRVTATAAVRQPAVEARLEGARDAAAVRRILKAR